MKERIKTITIIILIVMVISISGVYAATIISSINVGYNNENSKLVADNVQAAIDEVYDKSFNKELITAYEYHEQEPNKCINGEEKTCVKTDCYKKGKTCKQGTVIKYYVNDSEYHYFYVLRDDGTTITMQQRENTIRNIPWYEMSTSTQGPITVLLALEQATSTWVNVNVLEYEPGVTTLYENAYTGCTITEDKNVRCDSNAYILSQRKARARMITVLEAIDTGCRYGVQRSCPDFMHNYLYQSKNYGGSYNNDTLNENGVYDCFYWTMSAISGQGASVLHVRREGNIEYTYSNTNTIGARAVVEITKKTD